MARRPMIAGNWKMHKTVPEAVALATRLAQTVGNFEQREVLVAPPFTALLEVHRALAGSRILLGAQNMYCEDTGAFTGEVSPVMLLSAGCTHVILGHSERRQIFGESDELINRKVLQAIRKELRPILCIGETLSEREAGRAQTVVESQLRTGLKSLTREDHSRIILAYEPVWAIGTGRTATPAQAQEMHGFIRGLLSGLFDPDSAGAIRILYGGSVKPDNISELMAEPDIDGALVGGASLKAEDFEKIVKF
jgi:triosephosphate isomerase